MNNTTTVIGIMIIVGIGMGLSLYYISRVNEQSRQNYIILAEIRKTAESFNNNSVAYFDQVLKTQITNENNTLGNLTDHSRIANHNFGKLINNTDKILDMLNRTG